MSLPIFGNRTAEQVMTDIFSEVEAELTRSQARQGGTSSVAVSHPDAMTAAMPRPASLLYRRSSIPPSLARFVASANQDIDAHGLQPDASLAAACRVAGFTAATSALQMASHKIFRDPRRKQAAFLKEIVSRGIRESDESPIYQCQFNNICIRIEMVHGADGKIVGGKIHSLIYAGFGEDFTASSSDKGKLEACVKDLMTEEYLMQLESVRLNRIWQRALVCAQEENIHGEGSSSHATGKYQLARGVFLGVAAAYFLGRGQSEADHEAAINNEPALARAETYLAQCIEHIKSLPAFQETGYVATAALLAESTQFHQSIGMDVAISEGQRKQARVQAVQIWDNAMRQAIKLPHASGKEVLSALSLEERTALYLWTKITFRPLNQALSSEDCHSAEKVKPLVHCIVSGLNKMRRLYPTQSTAPVLYRGFEGMTNEQMDAFKNEYRVGAYGRPARFWATSPHKDIAHSAFGASAKLTLRGTRSGAYLAPVSTAQSQDEVLFPPGCIFQVESATEAVEDGKRTLQIELREATREEYETSLRIQAATRSSAKQPDMGL